MSDLHLWEKEHPYYGTGEISEYRSWNDFLAEWADADEDYNLVYRWDWEDQETEDGETIKSDDPNYRASLLSIFFIIQRKGRIVNASVQVCRNDESEIRKYLEKRFAYLKNMWAPL